MGEEGPQVGAIVQTLSERTGFHPGPVRNWLYSQLLYILPKLRTDNFPSKLLALGLKYYWRDWPSKDP